MTQVLQQPETSPGWAGNPKYIIDFDLVPARVAVKFNGLVVAESDRTRVLYELGHAPAYYLPLTDLWDELFIPSDHKTFCPYKGLASYFHLKVGDKSNENVVWHYENPYPQIAGLKGYAGFYWGRMDQWLEDGEPVTGPREIPGRINTTNQLSALFPDISREWHPTRNPGLLPYEFSPDSNEEVWWQDESGQEWRERIKDRVLAATTLRADGDATPWGKA